LPGLDKVEALVDSLNDPATRSEAGEAIRALEDRIVEGWDEAVGGPTIEIVGELAALLTLGTNENAAAFEAAASSLKLVAGAGKPFRYNIWPSVPPEFRRHVENSDQLAA
jgi:hypothetical protein